MAVNRVPSRAWSLYRELFNTVQTIIHCGRRELHAVQDLDATLRKFKPDFLSLLQNPTRVADDRNAVKQATQVGLPVQSDGGPTGATQTLTTDFIAEALTISDLFELNELASVELLSAGEAQQSYYPGLPRGLVAILLYFDGKACMVHALRILLQARSGRTWVLPGIGDSIVATVTSFTNQLIEDGLIGKILAKLTEIDVTKTIEKLESPEVRALGPPRHRQQVIELLEDIRQSLADCVFCISAQSGLNRPDTLSLINFLSRDQTLSSDAAISNVSLTLTMAILYAVDVRVLEQEDSEVVAGKLPIIHDVAYADAVHREICSASSNWSLPGLLATIRLAWALTVQTLAQYRLSTEGVTIFPDEDEALVDAALVDDVFSFIRTSIVANSEFHSEEYYVRKIHYLVTDFIVQMPLKVQEIRNSGDETARIIIASQCEGLVPGSNLRRDFEYMLLMMGDLYAKDPLGLELMSEFWYHTEPAPVLPNMSMQGGFSAVQQSQTPHRQISLFKFVRLAGDLLLPPLYVPYITMLAGLANGSKSAHHCFNLLRANGSAGMGGTQLGCVSWEHFFASLNQYYVNLRQSMPLSGFTASQFHHQGAPASATRGITPAEVDGLRAVLHLIYIVAKQDENSRIAMSENQVWLPLLTLVGLLTCAVPVRLKSAILDVLAAFAKTPQIATTLWQSIESAQILQTIAPTTGIQQTVASGVQLELEEVEARNEEYPMLLSLLGLLNSLTDYPIPTRLGAGYRVPGFQPYLDFLRDSVLLKFPNRAYKRPAEKWEVAGSVLEILFKLLQEHEVCAEDFVDQPCHDVVQTDNKSAVLHKPPGHTLLIHMMSDSAMLKTILFVIDEAVRMFDKYVPFPGKSAMEKASLYCLKIIETSLQKQDAFLDAMRQIGATVIGSRMDKLLLSINPRSGRSDHLINIAKFVTYNSSLPRHAFSALRSLLSVCQSPVVQSKIVGLFTASEELSTELLRGFVECIETEESENVEPAADEFLEIDVSLNEVRSSLRQDVVWLLLSVVDQPAPNLAHFLLGFDVRKPISRTNLQDPGVLGTARTCLHGVICALNRGVDTRHGPTSLQSAPQFSELAYRLLFVLCSDRETSNPVLRYLRTHDFFYRHAQHLPFITADSESENVSLMQQSWLIKSIVVELRILSLNRQRSHAQRLMSLLLDDSGRSQAAKSLRSDGLNVESDFTQIDNDLTSATHRHLQGALFADTPAHRKLLTILGSIDLIVDTPEQFELSFFNPPSVDKVIADCEQHQQQQRGIVLCNVKLLHKILSNECNAIPTAMAGQRTLIMEEVENICKLVVQRNVYRTAVTSRRQSFDAWRQLVEILLTACPTDLLQGEMRQNVILELLQDLLDKVSKSDTITELTQLVAGVLLTLMSHLSQTFRLADLATADTLPLDGDHFAQYIALLDDTRGLATPLTALQHSVGDVSAVSTGTATAGLRSLYASSLQVVLRGLLQHVIRSSASPPRVRAYLYGTLLYYLQIAQRPKPINYSLAGDTGVAVDAGGEFDRLARDNLATIKSFGSNLMDIICRDVCDGHDVGRMLALATLDMLLIVDYQKLWFSHLSSNGYIQHIIDSLLQDDALLRNLLLPQPEPLRALYIFQSKIALLTRLAESPVGARLLLECSLTSCLSQCSVFDLRPESDKMAESFIPTILARYRQQILFPVLRLLLALLVTLGTDNRLAAHQVLQFIVVHSDVFLTILRDRQPNTTLESLQELALTTAIIARAAIYDSGDDWTMAEMQAIVSRLQRHMLALLPKYCVSDVRQNQHRLRLAATAALAASNPSAALSSPDSAELEDIVARMETYIYDVLSNVISLCSALVTKSGNSAKQFRVLFEPTLYDGLPRDSAALQDMVTSMCSTSNTSSPPHLGIVLYLLSTSSHLFTVTLDAYKQQHRKFASLSDLSADEIKQLYSGSVGSDVSGSESMSAQRRSQIISARLVQSLRYKSQQLRQLSHIIENSMFLLWRHLEFFLVYCSPVDTRGTLYQLSAHKQQLRPLTVTGLSSPVDPRLIDLNTSGACQTSGVTREQLAQLKRDVVASLNDALFTSLNNMEESYTRVRTRFGFVSALIRRLKRLVRLHTGGVIKA